MTQSSETGAQLPILRFSVRLNFGEPFDVFATHAEVGHAGNLRFYDNAGLFKGYAAGTWFWFERR